MSLTEEGGKVEDAELKGRQQQQAEGKLQLNSPDIYGTGSGSLLEPDACLHLWKFAT